MVWHSSCSYLRNIDVTITLDKQNGNYENGYINQPNARGILRSDDWVCNLQQQGKRNTSRQASRC